MGKKARARAAAKQLSVDPLDLYNRGLSQFQSGELTKAAESFRRAVQAAPSSPEIWMNLGAVLNLLSNRDEAEEAFKRAIETTAPWAAGYADLGAKFMSLAQYKRARRCGEKAVELDSECFDAQFLLAQALVQLGYAKRAREHAEKALALESQNASVHALYAMVQQSLGLMAEGNASYRRSLELDSHQTYPYFALAFHEKGAGCTRVERMRELLNDPSINERGKQMLHYALARSLEKNAEYEESMRHYDRANQLAYRIKFGGQETHGQGHRQGIEWAINTFTPELFDNLRSAAALEETEDPAPLFIVGMVRSGTTIMEQILASHPDVEGAGEQSFWIENATKALDSSGRVSPALVQRLARQYLRTLRDVAPDGKIVVDKMPTNAAAVALIHLAFPNAKIIHMNRSGADTCFSIYATPNEARNDYFHERKNIAAAYKRHLKLRDHWRSVLPSQQFIEVSYEELVGGQEGATRHVLELCDLEWDERCLKPEENVRTVATPSLWQAREAVFASSVGRWKYFEPWVPEFAAVDG